jgi:hypothetical protein
MTDGTQEAQQLVLQAAKSAAPERNFEANNYFPMVQVRHVCSNQMYTGNVLALGSGTTTRAGLRSRTMLHQTSKLKGQLW